MCQRRPSPTGGHPAGRRDPVRSAAAGVSRGAPSPQATQAGAHLVHDRVVHVRFLPHAALGFRASRVGHVPLRGCDISALIDPQPSLLSS